MLAFLTKYRDIVYMVLIVLFMFLFVKSCNNNKTNQKGISDYLGYQHIANHYKTKNGTLVSYNKNLSVAVNTLIAAKDSLVGYIDNLELKLKDVKSTTIITSELRTDTIRIPIYLTDCEFDTTVQIAKTHYDLDISISNDEGVTLNSMKFPNRQGITISEKREKWWKKKETIVAVTNSNPYMVTNGITSYTLQQRSSVFGKWWVHVIEGVLIGGITYMLVK